MERDDSFKTFRDLIRKHPDRMPTVPALGKESTEDDDSLRNQVGEMSLFGFRYEDVTLIAETRLSKTWKAFDRDTSSYVVIKAPHDRLLLDQEYLERFRREVRLVSSLSHRNIVPIREAAISEPPYYYTMPFITGRHLDDYCGSRQLTVKRRLTLFAKICRAVGRAHQHGIIHRDLKPSNILVDEDSEPQLLDFGLGRVSREGAPDDVHGASGTPAYMSPEQAAGLAGGTQTDVYSLGVIAFELLTNRLPIESCDDFEELLRRIREDSPRQPQEMDQSIGRELAAVVLKALFKVPSERHRNADELADDVDAILASQPVSALPRRPVYVASKWLRRHWGVVCLVSAALIVIIAVLVLGTVARLRTAEAGRHKMAVLSGRSLTRVGAPALASSALWAEQHEYDSGRTRFALWEFYRSYPCVASAFNSEPDSLPLDVEFTPEARWVVSCWNDGRIEVHDVRNASLIVDVPGDIARARSLALLPNADALLVGGADGHLRSWEFVPQTGALVKTSREHALAGVPINALEPSLDGELLIAAAASIAYVLDTETWELLNTLSIDGGPIVALVLSPDGTRLAAGTKNLAEEPVWEGKLVVWDLATGQAVYEHREEASQRAVCFSPDGSRLYAGGEHLTEHDLAAGTRRELERESESGVRAIAVSEPHHGARLAFATGSGRIRFLKIVDEMWLSVEGFHDAHAYPVKLALSRDGEFAASASRDGLKIWELGQDDSFAVPAFDVQNSRALDVSSDGGMLAVVNSRRLFYHTPADALREVSIDFEPSHPMMTPDGGWLIVAGRSYQGSVTVGISMIDMRSAENAAPFTTIPGAARIGSLTVIGASDKLLVPISFNGTEPNTPPRYTLCAIDLERSHQTAAIDLEVIREFSTVCAWVCASLDTRWIVACSEGNAARGEKEKATVTVWHATGRDVSDAAFEAAYAQSCEFVATLPTWRAIPLENAEGELIVATTGASDRITLWDPFTGKQIGSVSGHHDIIYHLFPLTNRLFVSAARDRTVRVWDAWNREEVCLLHRATFRDPVISVRNGRIAILDGPNVTVADTEDIERFLAGNRDAERARAEASAREFSPK